MGEIIEGWSSIERELGISESTIRRYMRAVPLRFDQRSRIGYRTRVRITKKTLRQWWKQVTAAEMKEDGGR